MLSILGTNRFEPLKQGLSSLNFEAISAVQHLGGFLIDETACSKEGSRSGRELGKVDRYESIQIRCGEGKGESWRFG